MMDNENTNTGFPINSIDLAYIAPFLGVVLLGCCALVFCDKLRRWMSSSCGYPNSIESSSSSGNQRSSQRWRQNQLAARGRTTGVGHQFVPWTRDLMHNLRNAMRGSSVPRQNYQTQAGLNSLLTPMAAEYPRATQGGARSGHNPSRTTANESLHVLSESGGFSQVTAPPPSYLHAMEYQNTTMWNLPGYGYQSTDPRREETGGELGEGDQSALPPPYETAVASGQNTTRIIENSGV